MFCLFLNSEDMRGGAARAAYRLHEALRKIGVDARMLVQIKHGDAGSVIGPVGAASRFVGLFRRAADLAPLLRYPSRQRVTFYPGWLPDTVGGRVGRLAPDLLHLHWITGGFLNVSSLTRLRLPMVWTLHDMWAFTGGCHYDNGCGKYAQGCGTCPVLGSDRAQDVSRRGWKRKERAYQDLALTLVSPSNWLRSLASQSPLLSGFPTHVIPNAIDTGMYTPASRSAGRARLAAAQGRKLILFGAANAAADPRKGMGQLARALKMLAHREGADKFTAVIFGADAPSSPPDFGMQVIYAGVVKKDAELAELYAAADVFVAPSLQENLSNAVMEALACGTPCVAFDVGGMPDMIEHRGNGYVARPGDPEDLAEGIRWVLQDEQRRLAMAARAREKCVSEYDAVHIARRHLDLYQSILAVRRNRIPA